MTILLEGGCRVTELEEGEPAREGALRIRRHFGRESGTKAISLRILELKGWATLRNEASDEVLYVLRGTGRATLDGEKHLLSPDSGIFLPPLSTLELESESPLTLFSAQCPEPGARLEGYEATANRGAVVSLNERPLQRTGDRAYREILNEEIGSGQVPQFVGIIPPVSAPDHSHLYEEVLCILDGHGVMWAGQTHTPIKPGSCIFLPRRQVHCVENAGPGELRLLGVFYPAGSPAVRYS